MQEKIAVIGLGYVGLPVAVALGRVFTGVVGLDINARRVETLQQGEDYTREVSREELAETKLQYTTDRAALKEATFFIVTVPTPIDAQQRPDLSPLVSACETVGPYLKQGDIVVFESTVYPGVTEEYCAPILEKISGLKSGVGFFLGYSPERISPGDKERTFEKITKIVSAQTPEALARVRNVYGAVVTAGLYEAPSIKVAEAAKVIENTQRDLNIALMNELAMIFHRVGISTSDVLAAAGTKWNFLKFTPGLVGGHCIGVDPYYLTTEAERLGYFPHLILAGRRINDGMGIYITEQIVKKLIAIDRPVKGARVGILGLTFKENVPDLRNSRIPDIINALAEYGITAMLHDPFADPFEVQREYGLTLTGLENMSELDVLILAVAHDEYRAVSAAEYATRLVPGGLLVDIKSLYKPRDLPDGVHYWSL
ncbi:MAG: NDP-sugar dehydrogenase [Alphaproteobacteria bacterium]|nr:NDP-sugar dehydrogenase [Alphaproteobacteria bacterium]